MQTPKANYKFHMWKRNSSNSRKQQSTKIPKHVVVFCQLSYNFIHFCFPQVWSASSLAQHNPPTDFLWKEQNKWGTGPECTTILCKPNGQVGI